MGSIPVGGTKYKAGTVQSLPAFFVFPMRTVILSCGKVRDSVTHSGGTRGHFWGQSFQNWGHHRIDCRPAGALRLVVFRGYPPSETRTRRKPANRSVYGLIVQSFSPPYPAQPHNTTPLGKSRHSPGTRSDWPVCRKPGEGPLPGHSAPAPDERNPARGRACRGARGAQSGSSSPSPSGQPKTELPSKSQAS